MNVILWLIAAIGAAFGIVYVMTRRAMRRIPPLELAPGESMPTTALQRLARTTLAAVSLLTVFAAAIVLRHGAQVYFDNDHVRLTVTGLLVAALVIFAVCLSRVAKWTVRDDGALDERDRAILAHAPAAQAPAMIVTLAAWSIALVETSQPTHMIPSVFLYLIFWSCIMVSVLALLAGVVLGYRRH